MKKLMFAAFAAATVAGTAFAAAPEPDYKAYNLTITGKRVLNYTIPMTKKNVPAEEVEQTWEELKAAAPLDSMGNPGFFNQGETTNTNGKVTLSWMQYKPVKIGTNVVAATKVFTEKDNYIVFMDKDNKQIAEMICYYQGYDLEDGCKYRGIRRTDFSVQNVTIHGDGNAMAYLAPERFGGMAILAGQGKAAKSNPSDNNAPYDYAKSLAGSYADWNCKYGTWKWSYDKKLSQAYQKEIDDGNAKDGQAIINALKSKKIYLPVN